MLDGRIDLGTARFARLDEYFGAWSIDQGYASGLWQTLRGMDLQAHIERKITVDDPKKNLPVSYAQDIEHNGVPLRVIHVTGMMMKQRSSLTSTTSTVIVQRDLRRARADPDLKGVMMVIESPGGTVAGNAELAAEVAATAEVMPVVGHIEDLCASAAMWIGSQCDTLHANTPTASVGSIGTVLAFFDVSERLERDGIEPVVISTGPLKGVMYPGTKCTDEHKAYLQRLIDGTQRYFTKAVADGRGMSVEQVTKLATGEVFLAEEATKNGLIDGIRSTGESLDDLAKRAKAGRKPGNTGRSKGAARATAGMTAAWQSPTLDALGAAMEDGNLDGAQEAATMAEESTQQDPKQNTQAAEGEGAGGGKAPGTTPAASPQANADPAGATPGTDAKADGTEAPAATGPAATFLELKAALPKSDAAFREKCQEAGLTVAAAKDHWIDHLESRESQLQDQLKQTRSAAESLKGDAGTAGFQSADGKEEDAKVSELAGQVGPELAKYAASIKVPGYTR